MLIKDCNIIYLNEIKKGSVLLENGKIKEIDPENITCEEVINGENLYLSPGFIDVHIHGAGGVDTMNGTYETLNTIAKTIAVHGTTGFTPTTMTVPLDEIRTAVEAIKNAKIKGTDGALVLGAHLEGPFISPKAIGAQNPNYLVEPTIENFNKMVGDCEDAVICMTMAPEIKGAKELASYLEKKGIHCSIGHSRASYEEILESVKSGFCHATHLFNAMTPFTHRDPGVVGAIFNTNISTETICDGIHIAYPSLEIAFKQKGYDNVFLVSDAMEACGMPDGTYSLGGQPVIVSNGAARLNNGALAGSILTLDKAISNITKNANVPLIEAIKMATYNPAKYCNVSHKKGLIKENFDADLVLFDESINVKLTIINGKVVYNNL